MQPGINEITKTRELMQMIVKTVSWDNGIEMNRGTGLPEIYVRKAIIKIRNLNPKDNRTTNKWINRLLEREFIRKKGYNMFEVLDTGKDWGELEPTETEVIKPQDDIIKEELK